MRLIEISCFSIVSFGFYSLSLDGGISFICGVFSINHVSHLISESLVTANLNPLIIYLK